MLNGVLDHLEDDLGFDNHAYWIFTVVGGREEEITIWLIMILGGTCLYQIKAMERRNLKKFLKRKERPREGGECEIRWR